MPDFIADQRAPHRRPPNWSSPDLNALQQRLQKTCNNACTSHYNVSNAICSNVCVPAAASAAQQPTQRLQQRAQRLDELELRLQQGWLRQQQRRRTGCNKCRALASVFPAHDLSQHQRTLRYLQQQLHAHMAHHLQQQREHLKYQAARLHATSPPAAPWNVAIRWPATRLKRLVKSVKRVR
ncbi:MAG: hypothetical protein R3E95_10985 [Thiolinea sp.]